MNNRILDVYNKKEFKTQNECNDSLGLNGSDGRKRKFVKIFGGVSVVTELELKKTRSGDLPFSNEINPLVLGDREMIPFLPSSLEEEDESDQVKEIFESIVERALDFLYDNKIKDAIKEINEELSELEAYDLSDIFLEEQKAYEKHIESYIKEINTQNKIDLMEAIAARGDLPQWLEILGKLVGMGILQANYFDDVVIPTISKSKKDNESALSIAIKHSNGSSLLICLGKLIKDENLSPQWFVNLLLKEVEGESVLQLAVKIKNFRRFWRSIEKIFSYVSPEKCALLADMKVKYYSMGSYWTISFLGYLKGFRGLCIKAFEEQANKGMELRFEKDLKELNKLDTSGKFELCIVALIEIYITGSLASYNEYGTFRHGRILQEMNKLDRKESDAETILKKLFSIKNKETGATIWHELARTGSGFGLLLNFMKYLVAANFLDKSYIGSELLPVLTSKPDINGFYAYQPAVTHSKRSFDNLLNGLFDMVDDKLLPADVLCNFVFMTTGINNPSTFNVLGQAAAFGSLGIFLNRIKKYFKDIRLDLIMKLFSVRMIKEVKEKSEEQLLREQETLELNKLNMPEKLVTGTRYKIASNKDIETTNLVREAIEKGYWDKWNIRTILEEKGVSKNDIDDILFDFEEYKEN